MTLGAERTPWRELAAEPTHELLDGFLPVVVTTLRYADLVVRQTVVGYSDGVVARPRVAGAGPPGGAQCGTPPLPPPTSASASSAA